MSRMQFEVSDHDYIQIEDKGDLVSLSTTYPVGCSIPPDDADKIGHALIRAAERARLSAILARNVAIGNRR